MSSGVVPDDECQVAYQALKTGKKYNGVKPRFIVFRLNDNNTKIIVDQVSDKPDYTDDFQKLQVEKPAGARDGTQMPRKNLPDNECRWAVYDFEYDLGDAGKRSKIVFIAWGPDTAPARKKMVFAASRDAFRRTLEGIGAEIQANDIESVDYEEVLQRVSRK